MLFAKKRPSGDRTFRKSFRIETGGLLSAFIEHQADFVIGYTHFFLLLESIGIIRRTETGIEVVHDEFHIPVTHPLTNVHQINSRCLGLRSISSKQPDDLFFSVAFTSSSASIRKIKTEVGNFLERIRNIVKDEQSEQVQCINIDFFSPS